MAYRKLTRDVSGGGMMEWDLPSDSCGRPRREGRKYVTQLEEEHV